MMSNRTGAVIAAILGLALLGSSGNASDRYHPGSRAPDDQTKYVIDSNGNGIDDQEDETLGVAAGLELVGNEFWPDSTWTYEHGELGPTPPDSIGRHLQVDYIFYSGLIRATWAVAEEAGPIRLILFADQADSVVVYSGPRRRGLQRQAFRPVDAGGRPLGRGVGRLRVTVGETSYERAVAWRWYGK